jgi:hypothetical protein
MDAHGLLLLRLEYGRTDVHFVQDAGVWNRLEPFGTVHD